MVAMKLLELWSVILFLRPKAICYKFEPWEKTSDEIKIITNPKGISLARWHAQVDCSEPSSMPHLLSVTETRGLS